LAQKKVLQTILYVDDQIITVKSEDDLQTATHKLNKTADKYNMTISTSKLK
jgi:hypothetical protein